MDPAMKTNAQTIHFGFAITYRLPDIEGKTKYLWLKKHLNECWKLEKVEKRKKHHIGLQRLLPKKQFRNDVSTSVNRSCAQKKWEGRCNPIRNNHQ